MTIDEYRDLKTGDTVFLRGTCGKAIFCDDERITIEFDYLYSYLNGRYHYTGVGLYREQECAFPSASEIKDALYSDISEKNLERLRTKYPEWAEYRARESAVQQLCTGPQETVCEASTSNPKKPLVTEVVHLNLAIQGQQILVTLDEAFALEKELVQILNTYRPYISSI